MSTASGDILGQILFLGTGSSQGVPVIGCSCTTCLSEDPLNMRLRTSAMISFEGKNFLIDAGPDFRQQALRYSIGHVEALFLTHTHYDHIAGVEELRIYNFKQQMKLPCYLSSVSLEAFKKHFYYHFSEKSEVSNYTAEFDFHTLDNQSGSFQALGKRFTYFVYKQGGMDVLGVRLGSLAYVTDIKEYSDDIFDNLRDLDILVVSAQRFGRSLIQFSFDEAVAFANRVGARTTYLTHLSHEIEYHHAEALLQQGIHLAYDGLKLSFTLT